MILFTNFTVVLMMSFSKGQNVKRLWAVSFKALFLAQQKVSHKHVQNVSQVKDQDYSFLETRRKTHRKICNHCKKQDVNIVYTNLKKKQK